MSARPFWVSLLLPDIAGLGAVSDSEPRWWVVDDGSGLGQAEEPSWQV